MKLADLIYIDPIEVVRVADQQSADLDKPVMDDVELMVAMLRASLQTPDRRQAPRS